LPTEKKTKNIYKLKKEISPYIFFGRKGSQILGPTLFNCAPFRSFGRVSWRSTEGARRFRAAKWQEVEDIPRKTSRLVG